MYLSKISRRDRSERSSFEYTCKMSCHNEACLENYLCKMSSNIFFMCTSPEHHGDIFCFLGDQYTLQSKSTCHKLSVRCKPSSFRAKTFPSSDSKKKLAGGGHYEDDSSGKFIMTSFMKSRWKHNLFQTLYCDNLSEEPYPDSCYQPFGKVDFFRRLKGYFRCSRPVRPSIPMSTITQETSFELFMDSGNNNSQICVSESHLVSKLCHFCDINFKFSAVVEHNIRSDLRW